MANTTQPLHRGNNFTIWGNHVDLWTTPSTIDDIVLDIPKITGEKLGKIQ